MKLLIDMVVISLFCNGWYLITRPGMIFSFIHEWYVKLSGGIIYGGEAHWNKEKPFLQFIYKPLFGCVTCMASIWGTTGYFALGNQLSFQYPIIIISVSCMNLLIHIIYEK